MVADSNSTTPAASQFPDPIPGILPCGSIGTLAGATGVGKTALVATWIARWQRGQEICGHPTQRPTQIGIIVGDRRWASHQQWLTAAGCLPVAAYSLRDDPTFPWADLRSWQAVAGAFGRCLDRLQLAPGGLVVLDPMAIFLPGKVNDYKDMALGLGVLDQVLQPRILTCLGIFHQAKQINDASQQYKRPQDRILGSAAQLGFSDTAMYLLGPEDMDRPYYGFGWVPHHAPAETFAFKRDNFGLFVPYDGPIDEGTDATSDRPTQILQMIPAGDEGISTTDLVLRVHELFGISRATIYRDLKTLENRKLIERDEWGTIRRRKVN